MLFLLVDVLYFSSRNKKGGFDLAFIKSCCPACFNEFVLIPLAGASRGLIIIWDSTMFSSMVIHYEPFAIYVHFTSTQSAQSWTLVNVYGPYNGDARDEYVQWIFYFKFSS
jgi:hypothetical protein